MAKQESLVSDHSRSWNCRCPWGDLTSDDFPESLFLVVRDCSWAPVFAGCSHVIPSPHVSTPSPSVFVWPCIWISSINKSTVHIRLRSTPMTPFWPGYLHIDPISKEDPTLRFWELNLPSTFWLVGIQAAAKTLGFWIFLIKTWVNCQTLA